VLAYDLLNRPIVLASPDDEVLTAGTAVLPDGTSSGISIPAGRVATTYKYSGRVSRVRNPKGVVTRVTTNSQGWETEVVQNETGLVFDADSGEQTMLTKTYDALGNLLTSSTAGSTIVNVFDRRGRRLQTTDPDMGTWTYKYNGFGELVEQVDAKFQKTTHTYDVLGRPQSRLHRNASGVTIQNTVWTWFGPAAALGSRGKLHTIETVAGTNTSLYKETHAYDALGRPTSSTRTIPDAEIPAILPGTPLPSTSYTTTLHYDAVSRVERVVYPTGFATRNVYNAFGALKEVRRSDAGRNDVFWMAEHDAGSDPSVAISRFLLGNGVTTERIASRATGRVRDIASGVRGGYGLQQIEYDYDVLGNVKKRTDAATGLVENAFYDALNRLDGFVSTLGANVTNTDVDYAANGNITWKSDVGAYAYGAAGAGPHAVTSAGAHTYTYDANGGMLTGAGRAIQWTAFNQIRRIDQGGQFSEFWFGAAHERVGQRNNHGRTVYVGGIYERFTPTGSGPTEHRHWISTPAGRIAVHKTFSTGAPKTDYFHHDALGSITVVTNEKGVKVERFRYDAWGKRLDGSGQPVLWANNAGITRGFTDHEHLDDLGLVHMNGRVYDPVLARFLSADPFIDGASDSQGFNRYTYVHNNPLNATDPSGFLSFKDVLKIVAVVVAAVVTAGLAVYGAAAAGIGVTAAGATAVTSFSTALGAIAGGALSLTGAVIAGVGAGFGSGFAGSLLNGGSLGDAFQAGLIGGLIGGVSAGVAYGIGNLANQSGWEWFKGYKWASHGLSQGLITEASGGEFRHGFYAAAFTSMMGGRIERIGKDLGDVGEIAAAAVVGGTASAIGGGKFANGAASGVFTYLFNDNIKNHQAKARTAYVIAYPEDMMKPIDVEEYFKERNAFKDKMAGMLGEDDVLVVGYSGREDFEEKMSSVRRLFSKIYIEWHTHAGGANNRVYFSRDEELIYDVAQSRFTRFAPNSTRIFHCPPGLSIRFTGKGGMSEESLRYFEEIIRGKSGK
jgi:RHS repeat-associated protein